MLMFLDILGQKNQLLWKVEITRDPVISSCDREGYYASFGSL